MSIDNVGHADYDSINPLVKIFLFLIDSIDYQLSVFLLMTIDLIDICILESINYQYRSHQYFLSHQCAPMGKSR
jgi:hypothetical protein